MIVKRKLKVMFDLHGVIESQPDIFKPLMKTMRLAGHIVYVCSGPHLHKIEDELKSLGYEKDHHYDEIISVADYLEKNGVVFAYDDQGNPWTDSATWWCSKGKIAKEFNIDLVIDDHEEYLTCLEPPTVFLQMK